MQTISHVSSGPKYYKLVYREGTDDDQEGINEIVLEEIMPSSSISILPRYCLPRLDRLDLLTEDSFSHLKKLESLIIEQKMITKIITTAKRLRHYQFATFLISRKIIFQKEAADILEGIVKRKEKFIPLNVQYTHTLLEDARSMYKLLFRLHPENLYHPC
jgi:hypothetical protein